jgi:hypothetical protein
MLEFVTENAQTVSRSKNGWKGRTELKGEAEGGGRKAGEAERDTGSRRSQGN